MTMFYVRDKEQIREIVNDSMNMDEELERQPLLESIPPAAFDHAASASWREYLKVEMKIPRVQTVAGILLGLLLLGMILMLVAEAIRETRSPDPFLVDYSTALPPSGFISFGNDDFRDAWMQGEALVAYRNEFEKMLFINGIRPEKGSPTSRLQQFLRSRTDSDAMRRCGIVVEHMKRILGICINTTLLPDQCLPETPVLCDLQYKYRLYNGSCNNLDNPRWGMSLTAFKRLIKPHYADGVSAPRKSKSGGELPNARYLSNELYTHRTRPRSNSTVLTLYFGLFTDHDIIRIGSQTGHDGSEIACCTPQVVRNPSLRHPECMQIDVPQGDPFYGPLRIQCLDFVRSASVPGSCAGEREQMNLVTSFLDASGVYGSFDDKNQFLRTFRNGQLKVCMINNTEMLPQGHHMSYECGLPLQNLYCFRAGDMRVNEQVELTALHTVWMREHNRIATGLHAVSPSWDDERLFQESRRLLIAELQHIAYNEFLPTLLGPDVMKQHDLVVDPSGGYEGYDPTMDPSIYNVFGAAAFRVGHSLIEGMLDLIGPGYTMEKQMPLHTAFLNPHIFYEKGLDLLLRGLVSEKSLSVDSYITDEVRNRLFQPPHGNHGMDLAAIGIQRGRDHGLPGYVHWRVACGLEAAVTWDDLLKFMEKEHVERLKRAYKSVEDIDLIPGSLSEIHIPGAMVGPVHACLIARQFRQTRVGDRFWFEVRNQAGAFSAAQLAQLYNSSMARLLCDNSDKLEEIQRWPMQSVSESNPMTKCKDIPKVDLKLWAES